MNIQDLVDSMNAYLQQARASTQMTLGALITALEALPADLVVQGVAADPAPHSYRGYYCDLAFEPGDGTPVATLLAACRTAMGQVFTGYKGGDYLMGATTPVWLGTYGSGGGLRLLAVRADGTVDTAEDAVW